MSFARVRALIIVGALTVAAVIFVVVAMVRDTQTGKPSAKGCPNGWVLANIRLPEPKEVKIKVFNATNTRGLESRVADDFRNRKFQVVSAAKNVKVVDGVALLRYGPKAVGGAHLLRAYFLDEANYQYDKNRKDDIIDVMIGLDFQQIGTTTEVNQSLAALGNPTLPEGACAADQ
jgi:LytR cell envelope-related transcriptional attenuator